MSTEMAGTDEFYHVLTSGKLEGVMSRIAEDPVEYISTCKYTEDEILRGISKAIVSLGDADFAFKLRLLLLLQEHSAIFVTTIECLEETVNCFTNYHNQLKSHGHMFLKCQILVTNTAILLNFPENYEGTFGMLFSKHCDQLLKILTMVNHKDTCLLRETACECLIAVETQFPCFFLNNLEELCLLCFKENWYPFQNYANLISCILKNFTKSKFLTRTNHLLSLMKRVQILEDSANILSNLEVERVVTNLLDVLSWCSCPSIHYIMSNICCVANMMSLNPFIFKTFIHRFMMTSNLMIFYTILKLKEFHQSAFSKHEDKIFQQLLVDKANHPSLNINERCMVLGWISQVFVAQNSEMTQLKDALLIRNNPFSLHLPFDSVDVAKKKINELCYLFSYFGDTENCKHCLHTFMKEIRPRLFHDDKGYYIAALYRAIYCSLSQNIGILESDYQGIAVSVIQDHPQFLMHSLDLINNVKQLNSNSSFASDTLSIAVYHITNLPVHTVQSHLHQYLQFLTEAVKEKPDHSHPKAIIKFLRKLMDARNVGKSSSWLIGHSILDICKQILCFHTSSNLFAELGALLYRIVTQHKDVDVKDRAQLYYMLLTTLSPEKITTLFQPKVDNLNLGDGITSFISGDMCYSFPSPILFLKQPVFSLTRVKNIGHHNVLPIDVDEHVAVSDYLLILNDLNKIWKSSFNFNLEIISDIDNAYTDVYGIVLSLSGPKHCGHIQSVKVPYLNKSKASLISIELVPLQPLPASIYVTAVFSSSSGHTCYTELHPVNLLFEDLFQPLPVPSHQQSNSTSWRAELSRHLWEKFTEVVDGKCIGHQSVMRLNLNELQYQEVLKKHLRPFITEENDEDLPTFTVGIFLPPRKHLIMKVEYKQTQNIIVSLASDSIEVLAEINLYFCKLEKLSM